jgi:hypothetical protein
MTGITEGLLILNGQLQNRKIIDAPVSFSEYIKALRNLSVALDNFNSLMPEFITHLGFIQTQLANNPTSLSAEELNALLEKSSILTVWQGLPAKLSLANTNRNNMGVIYQSLIALTIT